MLPALRMLTVVETQNTAVMWKRPRETNSPHILCGHTGARLGTQATQGVWLQRLEEQDNAWTGSSELSMQLLV